MKIGLMFNNLSSSAKKSLEFCRRIGLDGVQIGISYGAFNVNGGNPKKFDKFEKLLNKYQLEISAYCGELGGKGLMVEADNSAQIKKLKKMIDFAVKTSVKVISTHIGVIPEDTANPTYGIIRKALLEIGDYAVAHGVTIAIETGPEKATTLKVLLDSLNGGIGINLDPANLIMVSCDDPVAAVYTLKDYIVHTHAKDGRNVQKVDSRFVYGFVNESDKAGLKAPVAGEIYHETCLGEGAVDWDKYIKALKDIGYKGYMAIEREYGKDTEADIEKAVELLRSKNNHKKILNIAVVGCGSIANAAHLPAIARTKEVKLKYVVDLIPERAEKAKAKYNAEIALTDYKKILDDKELDGVVVCTHTDFHTIVAVDCLKHGINVMSEKPVALTYADAELMAKTAKDSGKVLNVGVCMRFNTAVNRIKSMIDAGKIGKLYHIVCNFRAYRMIPGIGGSFTNKAESGGGVLMDWGVHYLDLIMYCLNNPEIASVSGDCYSELAKDLSSYKSNFSWGSDKNLKGVCDVEEYTSGHIRTEGGVSISFNGAWAQNVNKNETFIDFLGDKGGIRYDYCGNFTYYDNDLKETKSKLVLGDMYEYEFLSFIKDIRDTNFTGRNNIEKLLPTAKLLSDIYLSSEKKKEITNNKKKA